VWPVEDGVLVLGRATPALAVGEPELVVAGGNVIAVRQSVDVSRVSATDRAMLGAAVSVHIPDRVLCTARVTALSLWSRSTWQEDTSNVATQHASLLPGASATDANLRAQAKRLVESFGGFSHLVAELAPGVDCQGMWAAPADAPHPDVASFADPPPAIDQAALAQFHALPVFVEIDRAYARRKKPSEPAHWWELTDYSESAQLARLPDGRRIVSVSAAVCRGYDDFTMNLEVYFAATGDDAAPALKLLPPAEPSEGRWSSAIADLQGDGSPDILTLDGFILSDGTKLGEQFRSRMAIYFCPGDGVAASRFLEERTRSKN